MQAEEAFVSGDFARAAVFYARTPTAAPFEEVALKLIQAGQVSLQGSLRPCPPH